jgi:diguanylate cyclase (GGDEF)-like protein
MDFATLSPLAWLVACQFLLYTAGWGLVAAFMREHRAAALHWGGFMLLLGLGFLLSAARTEPRTFWPYAGSNICFVMSFVSMRRGMEHFLSLPRHDPEHLLTLAVTLFAFGALGSSQEHAPWRVVLAYGGVACVMLRTVMLTHPVVLREFGGRITWVQLFPALLLVLLFSARAIRQLLHPEVALEMHQGNLHNRAVFYAYLAGAAAFNFSFLSLMIQRMLEHLRHLSQHDALTGLLNRRALESALQREWQRARRAGRTLAVVALDLDHFKQVNDRHGHPVGDAVLAEAARRFQRMARQSDLVARTGGEEFVVLMPEADLAGAQRAAERLLAELRRLPVDLPGLSLPCTASAGVACTQEDDPAADAVLARADRALYRAKAHGRDRVVAHGADRP